MLIVTGVDLRDDVRLIKKYANFVLTKFVPKSVLRKSLVTIKFIDPKSLPTKEERKELKEVGAWMIYEGLTEEGKKKFTITLDSSAANSKAKKQLTKYKNLLKYLGHELVHVKQYLNNEMFDYKDEETVRFLGGHYKYSKEFDWAYWDSPWEIDAYGRMEGLYHMFTLKLKEEKKA